jgi:hypothetical protein
MTPMRMAAQPVAAIGVILSPSSNVALISVKTGFRYT